MKGKGRSQSMEDWINSLLSRGKYSFPLSQAHEEFTNCSKTAIRRSLDRLIKKGKIVSIRKGFYIIIPPQYASRGILPPSMYIDHLMRYLNREYYVGLLNAAAYYGATHQAPQEYYVITHYPALRPIQKKGTKINYITKRVILDKHLVNRKTETGYLKMSSPALTALDLIQYEKRIGGLHRAASLISQFTEQLNFKSVDLLYKSQTTTIQRLGYILEHQVKDKELADFLYKEVKQENIQFYRIPLKTSEKERGFPSDNRWKVIVNTEITSP